MANRQTLGMEQKLGMRLSQLHLRYVNLLEMTAPELDEAVERELEDNPALEADGPAPAALPDSAPRSERFYAPSYRDDDARNTEFAPADTSETLREHLIAQLAERSLEPQVEATVRYLIDSLDSNGYLRTPPDALLDDMAFYHSLDVSRGTLEAAADVLKSLEPAGVGAADLRECLLLQLRRLPADRAVEDAIDIIDKRFEAFSMKHTHKLVSGLRLSPERVDRAIELIRSLNPKPGAVFGNDAADAANVIIPDFVVSRDEDSGRLVISLNNRIPELRIEDSFAEAYRKLKRDAKGRLEKGNEFVASRYNDAGDFIRILRQRQQTMHTVMTAIVALQKEYFDTEDIYRLRPMMIKDIAALTGLDISTISRATANKSVALPWGIFPLRFFFSDSVNAEAETEAVTNRKIEAEIRRVVDGEDKRHPLSDEKIREALEARGFELSRRTVTKYRERCEIPVARLRRHFS